MPAVADVQNTVERSFSEDPRVATAVMSNAETREDLETFWNNVYLRGRMLFEPSGVISTDAYAQPDTYLPASRWFVVGPDQTIVKPSFGYDPSLILATIEGVLATMPPLGDMDGDQDVDDDDFDAFATCFHAGIIMPGCRLSDFNSDGVVNCFDWDRFARAWPSEGSALEFAACAEIDLLQLRLEETPGGTLACWTGDAGLRPYNVLRGSLDAIAPQAATAGLGPVTCVERRSWDTCTTGNEDALLPASGEAFFYLVGRFDGELESFGRDSAGRSRLAEATDCVSD